MSKRSQLIIMIVVLCLIVFGVGLLLLDRNGYINIFADTADTTNVSASINSNFTVNKDQLATIDSEKLIISISEIKDNRCPLQVICFWPGTVDIKLNLVKNSRLLGVLDFSSYTDLEQKPDISTSTKSKNLGNYKIFLTGVGGQARDNNVSNLTATFYISLFSQGSAKSMIFKTGLASMNGKVLTAYQDSNVYIDEFDVKADTINGTEPYQYITTGQSEKLYFKAKKYLSQKKEYSFKDTDSITFEFSNLLIGDLNEDDMVNSLDWSLINKYWQQNNSNFDLTGDSTINSLDWSLMNANWGKQGIALSDGWQMYLDNTTVPTKSLNWALVNDFTYQLQSINLDELGKTKFDLVVMDFSQDEGINFTKEQIEALKKSAGGEKLVLSYMSIGEAERYRWYWDSNCVINTDYTLSGTCPTWLGKPNKDWCPDPSSCNIKVKYWDKDWQKIIFGTPTSYLDKIIDVGFDGIYLDIIDAYEYYGPGGEGEGEVSADESKNAKQEMVNFVKTLANYARVTKGKTDFGVFPQNGQELVSHQDYLEIITGIGREDTWFNGDVANTTDHINEVLLGLKTIKTAGKLVLNIDYVSTTDNIKTFYQNARNNGFVPYATTRNLEKITINPGYEPD